MAYQDDTEMIARLIAERDYTKTLKNAAVEQLTIARQERDAARAQLASMIEDYQSRLVDAFNDTGKAVMERDATREELAIARKVMDKVADQRDAARAEAAALREHVLRLRDACESVAQNMEASGQLWSSWHTSIAIARLRDALDMTASDNSSRVAP